MGDRHGGCFARRGRALNPLRPHVDAHRGVDFRWRATVFRCRGMVGRICPRENAPLGESLPTRRPSERICPRENAPLGESLSTRRTGERICPAQERSPRRKSPDTAHGRKDLPRAGTRPSAKASRHGARAKGFARAGTLPSAKASRHGARAKGFAPRGSRSPHVPTNGGPPSVDGQPKNTPSAGSHPQRAAAAEFIHLKK